MSERMGWYSDPKGSYLYRYWDGARWTNQVSNGGVHSGIDPEQLPGTILTTPPAPGTGAPSATAAVQPTVQATQSSGSTFGRILAGILAALAVVVLIVILANLIDNSGSSGTDAPEAPATTAPETTSGE